MKKFKLPLLLLAVCLIVCLIGVMAACNGETATDGTQDNTDPILPSTPEEEKPEQTVEELSKAECENILQAKTENLLSSVEVVNRHEIEFLKSADFFADFSADFTVSAVEITKVNLNGGEVYGSCTLTSKSDGALHSVYFVLKTNLFSLDRTSYEVLKEELAYLNAYYVSVYENSADIPATDGFFDFNSLVAGETVPSPLTEEDYKEQCTEIINVKTLMGMNELMDLGAPTISNSQINLLNIETGNFYCNATKTILKPIDYFYILETNLNTLDITSYEALCGSLYGFEVVSKERQTMIQQHAKFEPEVSAEAYANLVNFVISNSIGWGPAGTDVEILNVSIFKSKTDGSGRRELKLYVLKDDTLYEIRAEGSTGIGSQEDQIEALLECQAEEITFTSESFSDFNDIGK